MRITEERIWAGSETSLQSALDAEVKLAAGTFNQTSIEGEDGPRLLEVADGLATISIKGPLVNSDSPMLRYVGATGYPEIRDAILAAANDQEVKRILLDIDSGGGTVSGCDDTGKLIRLINDRVKPVTTYTDGNMCSAAYWLGCSAGQVYSGKASLVGSIGVISTFKEYSEQNKMEGIGVTVIRAGKHKALANQNEKLTPEARAQIQKIVDAAYGVFVEHVAAMRGRSYEYADKTMADGQEFIGQAAVDVGLTNGITTFDALMTDLKQKIVASANDYRDNRGNGSQRLSGASIIELSGDTTMAKKPLTEQDIAALAAGAAIDLKSDNEGTADAQADKVAPTQDASEAEKVEEPKADVTEPTPGATAQNVDNIKATVQLLTSQLQAKDEALLQAGIKMARMEEELGAAHATHTPMLEIVAKSINNMQIALGGSAMSFEGMGPVAVLAEHTRLAEQFQSKFKAGGVSAVSGAVSAKNEQALSAIAQARLNAVRFS